MDMVAARSRAFEIDVVIPVYNAEKYLRQAVESVLSQTVPVKKIILINDGSTDDSWALIRRLEKENEGLLFGYSQNNLGPGAARNKGIRFCTSEWVALLDADDWWDSRKLEKQIKVVENSFDEKLGVVYVDYHLCSENAELIPSDLNRTLDEFARGNIWEKLLFSNIVTGCDSSVLVRRECFLKNGLFKEAFPVAEDWDLWLRIAKDFHFDYVPEKLCYIRRYSWSQSQKSKFYLRYILETILEQKRLYPEKTGVLLQASVHRFSWDHTSEWIGLLQPFFFKFFLKETQEAPFNGFWFVFISILKVIKRRVCSYFQFK